MADIFVCYAREDKEKVKPIEMALKAEGFSLFYDEQQPGSHQWRKTVYSALKNAHCLLSFLSHAKKKSHWMSEERRMFELLGKKFILRIDIEHNLDIDFPTYIDERFDLSNWDGDIMASEWQRFITHLKNYGLN